MTLKTLKAGRADYCINPHFLKKFTKDNTQLKINIDDGQARRKETASYSRKGMPQMLKTLTRKAPEAAARVADWKPSAFRRIIVAT